MNHCPDCWCEVPSMAQVCCPSCAKKRRDALAAKREGAGGQSCTDEDEAKMSGGVSIQNEESRKKWSGARNGRVIRKSEPMGG